MCGKRIHVYLNIWEFLLKKIDSHGNPFYSPTVDTDSPFVIHPIKTDLLPGELNNTFQANVMFSAMKEGQQTVCAHVSNNRYIYLNILFVLNCLLFMNFVFILEK